MRDEQLKYQLKRFNIWLASKNSRAVGVTVLGGKYLRKSVKICEKIRRGRKNHEKVGIVDNKGIGFRLLMQASKELKTPDPLHME